MQPIQPNPVTDHRALASALANFNVVDNFLTVAGRSLAEWADEIGTPFYIYDSSIIEKKVQLFRAMMPADIGLFYAVKANPHKAILQKMVNLVDGFDVASVGEVEAVVDAGGSPAGVSFAGPGKTRQELARAIELGIESINIESEKELDYIFQEAEKVNKRANISIRINPDFEFEGSGIKMGSGSKQFGIDAENVPHVLKKLLVSSHNFQGFHVYANSQNLAADFVCDILENTLALVWKLAQPFADEINILNLGGGFGIPYFEKDEELNIEQVGNHLYRLYELYRPKFPRARFIIELGRFLVGECGLYVARVLYKKVSRGKTYLITDGGMHHHLAASGNFGQVLRKNFPIIGAGHVHSQQLETVTIAGPLCTPLDVVGLNVNLPVIKEGDLIAILNSGSYGYTASPLFFLGHPVPTEIVV